MTQQLIDGREPRSSDHLFWELIKRHYSLKAIILQVASHILNISIKASF